MMEDPQQLHELLKLPLEERLRLARWLIDSAINQTQSNLPAESIPGEIPAPSNGLLALAGRFAGGPGDTADRAEEILESEVDSNSGLGVQ